MKVARKNYRLQPCCNSCLHVIKIFGYDMPVLCYCGLDAPPRPFSGSTMMNEKFRNNGEEVDKKTRYTKKDPFMVRSKAWDKWSKSRDVAPMGICDCHVERPDVMDRRKAVDVIVKT